MNRCEDDLVNAFGMDERGALRDWNEDYQNVRGMSGKTAGERIVRAKVLQKVLTDFGEAAVAGAMAVVQGMCMCTYSARASLWPWPIIG